MALINSCLAYGTPLFEFEANWMTKRIEMAIHILYSETPIHLPTADIDKTKGHLDNLYDQAHLSYLYRLSFSSTAVSTPLDTSNLCIEVILWNGGGSGDAACCLLISAYGIAASGGALRTRDITPTTHCHLPQMQEVKAKSSIPISKNGGFDHQL
eukprot:scaffold17325_cov109-Skeletonema_dohrnii-CCMP3373.AAC.4